MAEMCAKLIFFISKIFQDLLSKPLECPTKNPTENQFVVRFNYKKTGFKMIIIQVRRRKLPLRSKEQEAEVILPETF